MILIKIILTSIISYGANTLPVVNGPTCIGGLSALANAEISVLVPDLAALVIELENLSEINPLRESLKTALTQKSVEFSAYLKEQRYSDEDQQRVKNYVNEEINRLRGTFQIHAHEASLDETKAREEESEEMKRNRWIINQDEIDEINAQVVERAKVIQTTKNEIATKNKEYSVLESAMMVPRSSADPNYYSENQARGVRRSTLSREISKLHADVKVLEEENLKLGLLKASRMETLLDEQQKLKFYADRARVK